MTNKKILVVGASHIAAVMNLLRYEFQVPGVDFVMYGIHGPAFTDESLVTVERNRLCLHSVRAEGAEHHWFSNSQKTGPLDLTEFAAIILLEPLFIIGGFMRWQLWGRGEGICLEFLPEEFSINDIYWRKSIKPISSSEWLSIYTGWRRGTIRLFEAVRQLSPDIPILLFPPAAPPQRLTTGLYPRYNRREQAFLGRHLSIRYNAKFILQPELTMDADFQTLDEFHEPAPDPHHANTKYYRVIFDLVDFEAISFRSSPLIKEQ